MAFAAPPRVALVYSDDVWRYEMAPDHPLRPVRWKHTAALIQACGLPDARNVSVVPPRPATDDELHLFHDADYVATVKELSAVGGIPLAAGHGFGPGDNPVFDGMYEANALCAGGTMVAAGLLADGMADIAFNIAGGHQHHAMPGHASGFGVFNDTVMAARWLADRGMRVAYIDIDCHHADGVQAGFYDSPDVLTISLHESGQYLFPGTGHVDETGAGPGEGYAVNVPLAPYTSDDAYIAAFEAVVPPLVEAFKPDLVFTQLGIDTHRLDPITHLRLTVQGHAAVVARLKGLAAGCGRWLAVGGGGYDLGAVARAWTMDLALMAELALPASIPAEASEVFPDTPAGTGDVIRWADPPEEVDDEVTAQVRAFNERTVEQVQELIFPRFGLA